MSALRFVPYQGLGDIPNVIVDGSPTASTMLTLSHWPGSPTPVDLLDDLSAQIAFHAIDRPGRLDGIEAVSNNHFDQDGLASAYALLFPDDAQARRDRVIDVARAGDFGTFRDRDSMRIAIAIAAMEDPDRSPLERATFAMGYAEQCGRLYEAVLPRFGGMLDDVEALRPLWEREDTHLGESLDAIAKGIVRIVEHPALDLAIVTVPDDWTDAVTTRFTISRSEAVHPAAVNQATDCFRVALLHGHRYRVEMRYESWVMYRSRPVLSRPDLRDLAARLDDLDPGAVWSADRPGALTPILRSERDSTISPEQFVAELQRFLATAPPAWDPYASA